MLCDKLVSQKLKDEIEKVHDELNSQDHSLTLQVIMIDKLQKIMERLEEIYSVIPDVGKVRTYKEHY